MLAPGYSIIKKKSVEQYRREYEASVLAGRRLIRGQYPFHG